MQQLRHGFLHVVSSQSAIFVVAFIVVAALGVGGFFAYAQFIALSSEVEEIRSELASTTALLEASIAETHSSLSSALSEERASLESRLGSFQENVEDITETVGTLEKLSKTDRELLQKYSKVFFLNEHYVPERLSGIPKEYGYDENRSYRIHSAVLPFLRSMMRAAERDKIELSVFSAYRSFDEQSVLKGQHTVSYGSGANTFSADQGYSEHQLGTTVDFIAPGIGGTLDGFQNTEAYAWLRKNASRWGFVLSYPSGNNYYVFEPWHWRFVGEKLADDLHDEDRNFYDMDQREIDRYLVSIFD